MTHNIKNKTKVIAVTAMVATTAIIGLAHPFDTHNIFADDAKSSDSKGTTVNVDHSDLDKSVAAGTKAGMKITKNATKTKVITASQYAKEAVKIKSGYATQKADIDAKLKQQQTQNDAYDKAMAQYQKDMDEYNKTNALIPDRDDSNKTGLNTTGGVSSIDGWKFMMTGSRDKVHEAQAVVVTDGISETEAKHHYLKDGTILSWSSKSKLVDKSGSTTDFNGGYIFTKGGSVKLTNVGTLADGTNVNIVYKNASGDKNSWAISPKDPDQDGGKATGKIIIGSQDDIKLDYQFVDDNGKALKIWTGNFFSDIDEPTAGYIQNDDLSKIQTNGIAVVAKNVDANNYNLVRNDGVHDNTDSNLSSAMSITYSTGGTLHVYNSGTTKSTGYGVNDNRMISPMFGEELNLKVANKPVKPPKPAAVEASYTLTDLIVTPEPTKDVDTGENAGDKDGSDNGKSVIKGDELTYSLKATDLPADRVDDMKTIKYVDTLPKEVDYKSAKVYSKDGKTDLTKYFKITFDKTKHQFTAEATAEYLKLANADKTKAFEMPIVDVYTIANTSNAKFDNTYIIWENDDQFESNTVENSTPDIKPTKDVESGESKGDTDASIDGDEIKNGQEITYPLSVNDLPANRADDLKVFKYVDTLPKEVDYKSAKVYSKDGKTDLTKYFKISYDEKTRVFTAEATADFLKLANADKTKAFALPVVDVYAAANKDNATIDNKYDIWENDSKTESNTVENKTPGVTPTPKPDTPATPNTSYGEAPKGWLYGAIAAIVLVGAAFGLRKPIKKWFHK
ncbi:LPXTG cell wall anchor domain-containing protein [Leuconostoc pseudomesenteroides]|uniref:LPXTG cell wall anchor domain-containing protein n=1 Tax=Leuconostoc pseudomesenteroides TaxID=33968 RepID=UPI0021AA8950|nr:LPXTG cell wall anchor domain-containing protein [Leuconostoc pseudomesenteroides]